MEVGKKFKKLKGYAFKGEIRSVFTNSKKETRIVGEMIVGGKRIGLLHIFSPEQIQIIKK